ncbi:MAG: hypothetical protein V7K98_03420 [Nostoc sp.]|uniref:hypothetical protein n=1 Tax=Nostoc sp. TaxID=1180 RepID=UPI002FFBAEF5
MTRGNSTISDDSLILEVNCDRLKRFYGLSTVHWQFRSRKKKWSNGRDNSSATASGKSTNTTKIASEFSDCDTSSSRCR